MSKLIRMDEIDVHICKKCRAACDYCYIGRQHRCNHIFNDMLAIGDTETLKKIIRNIHDAARPNNLVFVGGDPCEHPDFVSLLSYAKSLGDMDIAVLSNTHVYRVGGEPVGIESIVPYVAELDFTLHGIGEEHDKRNHDGGSYVAAMEQLRQFMAVRNDDQAVAIALNFVPYTILHLEEMMSGVAEEIGMVPGLDYFTVQRIAPIGEAAEDYDQWKVINLNEALETMAKFSKRTGLEVKIDAIDAFPLCAVDSKHWNMLNGGGCKWGQPDGVLSVVQDGGIQRCALSERILGSFLHIDTPEKFTTFMTENPTLKAFMACAHLDDKCKSCWALDKCRGGCVIAAGNGDPYETDCIICGHDYLAV